MKNAKKKIICQFVALFMVCLMGFSGVVDAKVNPTKADVASVVQKKYRPETTGVYKLLKKNKKIKKSELKNIVKGNKFIGLVMFLFEYEDAMNARDQAKEKGFIKGLKSLEKSNKNVTLGDAIALGLRVTNFTSPVSDGTVVAACFKALQSGGVIPANKNLNSKFNYGVALNILEGVRLCRAEAHLERAEVIPVSAERMGKVYKPKKGEVKSPDGRYEAFLAVWSGMYNVFVKDLATGEEKRVSSAVDCDIRKIYWGKCYLFFSKDSDYDEHCHIWVAEFNGQKERDLTPIKGKSFFYNSVLTIKDYNDGVVVGSYDGSKGIVYNIINLENDKWTPVGEISEAMTNTWHDIPGDSNNCIEVTYEFNDGENAKVYKVNRKTRDETLIFEVAKNRQFIPQFVSADSSILYGLSNDKTNTLCPVALNLTNGELAVLYKDDDYDVRYSESDFVSEDGGNSLRDFGTSRPLMVQYYAKKFKSVGIDSKVKEALEDAKEKIGCDEIRVLNISPDLNDYILQRVTPYGEGNKYSYNLRTKALRCIALNETATVTRQFDVYMRPISYLSRDKLKIEGYLTLPFGKVPENLPTVVLVHGGPWGRDFWDDMSGEVAFLQSRGYAVLQVNFRGSTGYGREFLEKGDRQWGGKIQDDITDGAKWLIKKGIADEDRIAIYGSSFGGYAALCGLTFTPKLYACGVSYCGFSDVIKHLQNASVFWPVMKKQHLYHVGDPVADEEKLKKVSPAYHLDKIEKPLFVAHGANDPRALRAESDRVVNTLNEMGAKVEYMVREGEGHGFKKAQNRRDFYKWLEEFLARHLKPSKKSKTTKVLSPKKK
jgi:dipeptidyl aminopeptidase/acylaminoacyl peptidase